MIWIDTASVLHELDVVQKPQGSPLRRHVTRHDDLGVHQSQL